MLSCLLLALASLGAEAPAIRPVSYELDVRIEPSQGSIHVRAKLGIPRRNREESEVRFDLHETFEVKRLSVAGRTAAVSFQPAEVTVVRPASRTLVVRLPPEPLPNPLPVEIEYEGRLKELPEHNAVPGQLGLDDQINARRRARLGDQAALVDALLDAGGGSLAGLSRRQASRNR